MRCPKCGNELGRDEVFCGQCGTPVTPAAQPTEMVNTPPPRNGLLSSYNTIGAPPTYTAGANPTVPNTYNQGVSPAVPPTQPPLPSSSPQQSTSFYQDATEAISALPGNNNPGFPQQNYAGVPGPYPGSGMYAPQAQPFQSGNYAGPGYPQQPQTLPSRPGYGYGTQPGFTPPPEKKRSNSVLIVACICLVVAILIVSGIGALYLLRGQASQSGAPTSAPVATATTAPSPTPSPSPTATATPSPTPSPTTVPSPTPDPGFTFCDQACTTNGYSVEYPSGWQQSSTSDSTGEQFTNPTAPDQYAAFKATGATSATADQLINSDLQQNFAAKTNYMPPTSSQSTTIGGVTWVYAVATYTLSGQTERVQVYATVRQGKGYVIELEAADSQFATINSKYFVTMLGSFQFQ